MKVSRFLGILACSLGWTAPVSAEDQASARPEPIKGEIQFSSDAREKTVPAPFRLDDHRFAYEQRTMAKSALGTRRFEVTFPSPVTTPHPLNNTVHCEYYLPEKRSDGKIPGVVVLHILGGEFYLSRLFCHHLAKHQVAALFVKMPYYGPRRAKGNPTRMISDNPTQTVKGVTQAGVDGRRAA
ncbi:MAG: hypothetical protein N2C14_18555, partial [Planctomycetales bacterium]